MYKRFGPIQGWTDIHQLYNNGLTVSYGLSAENNFFDKTLEGKIKNDPQR